MSPPSAAVAGIVSAQASAMSPTAAHRTWRQRRRPPPTPTIDDATTWEVETGAPASEAPKITPADAVWLARPSAGWMR